MRIRLYVRSLLHFSFPIITQTPSIHLKHLLVSGNYLLKKCCPPFLHWSVQEVTNVLIAFPTNCLCLELRVLKDILRIPTPSEFQRKARFNIPHSVWVVTPPPPPLNADRRPRIQLR